MALFALLTVVLTAATVQQAPDRQDLPAAKQDFKELLEVVREVEESVEEGGRGVGGMVMCLTAAEQRAVREQIRGRASAELKQVLDAIDPLSMIRGMVGCVVVSTPARVRIATGADGVQRAEVEFRMRAVLRGEEGHPVVFSYRKVKDSWLLDVPPFDFESPMPRRAVATHAEIQRAEPEISPIVILRHFAAGMIPANVRESYAEDGIAIPANLDWADALWRGTVLHYPGIDSEAHTDPWLIGQPDRWLRMERTAVDQWLPNLAGTVVDGMWTYTNPVTIDAAADVPASTLVGALRVLAREKLRMPSVILRVAPAPGFATVALIRLQQPLLPGADFAATQVAAGLRGAELRAALGDELPRRVGVIPGVGQTVQDLVTTLDALLAFGVTDIFIVALPRE